MKDVTPEAIAAQAAFIRAALAEPLTDDQQLCERCGEAPSDDVTTELGRVCADCAPVAHFEAAMSSKSYD